MMAEQEVASFQGQLMLVRKALAKSRAGNDKLKKQLHEQVFEFSRYLNPSAQQAEFSSTSHLL